MSDKEPHLITPLALQLIKAELAPLASQLHEQYSVEYVATEMFDALGEDALTRATDAQRKQMQKDWLAKYDFFKTTIPIPDGVSERCFGVDAQSPLTARGEAVRVYGEAAVLAEAKKRGFASLTALKPERGPFKPTKTHDTHDLKKNPWSPQMVFRTDAERQAKQIEIIKVSAKLAASLAQKAGRTIAGQPLRASRTNSK